MCLKEILFRNNLDRKCGGKSHEGYSLVTGTFLIDNILELSSTFCIKEKHDCLRLVQWPISSNEETMDLNEESKLVAVTKYPETKADACTSCLTDEACQYTTAFSAKVEQSISFFLSWQIIFTTFWIIGREGKAQRRPFSQHKRKASKKDWWLHPALEWKRGIFLLISVTNRSILGWLQWDKMSNYSIFQGQFINLRTSLLRWSARTLLSPAKCRATR